MTKVETSLRVNFLYYGIQLAPIFFCLFVNIYGWLWKLCVFASLIWYNVIWVWLHRRGLDLDLLGVQMLLDTDRAIHMFPDTLDHHLIVTTCVKMDAPKDL